MLLSSALPPFFLSKLVSERTTVRIISFFQCSFVCVECAWELERERVYARIRLGGRERDQMGRCLKFLATNFLIKVDRPNI